jgi:hypothetical protein
MALSLIESWLSEYGNTGLEETQLQLRFGNAD